jgi:phosphoribosylamine---glycine ligase
MRVLVVGGGAREHALCWKLGREAGVSRVFCAPGNAGIGRDVTCLPLDAGDSEALLSLVGRERIDFTVIGPELPLTRGAVDVLTQAGQPVCGPTRQAAALESSKGFAKALMARHGIPTARFITCDSSAAAREALRTGGFGYPVVLKADGLAAGKGVIVAQDAAEAESGIRAMMDDRRFGDAGAQLVIEEFLRGREASFFVITDGQHVRVLPSAEDHKRAFDGDQGPNTGGMGAFSPSPLITDEVSSRILDDIVHPTLRGMASEGHPYRGFLYCGLMLTDDGPKVIEFNARLGDPETQVVLPRLDEDMLPHLQASAAGSLAPGVCRTRPEMFVGVVLASGGYPDGFDTGKPIAGLDRLPAGALVFHAGTAERNGQLVTAGGRVLTVVGHGADFAAARGRAYDAVSRLSFEKAHYRRDIGVRAVDQEDPNPDGAMPCPRSRS